jgi:hypothetical protein
MRHILRSAVVATVALAALVAFAGNASAQGPNKCLAGKNKCASKKAQGILKCWIKAEKDGVAVDPICLSKAKVKFGGTCDGGVNVDAPCHVDSECPGSTCDGGCFTKLEDKDAGSTDPIDTCLTANDATAMENKVDAFVDDVLSDLDPAYPVPGFVPGGSKCDAGKKKCVLKKMAGILKCHEKAVKTGFPLDPVCVAKARGKFGGFCDGGVNVDQVCLQDSDCPGSTCEKGCFTKLEDKDAASTDPLNTCHSGPGNAPSLEAKTDAFVQDVLCELGYTTLTCVVTTPTPTTTPCPTSTPGGSCPVTVQADADGPAVDLDTGWTGLSHDAHVPTNGRLTLNVSGCAGGVTPPCGQCNLTGPIANAGGPQFDNHRCVGDISISCNVDLDCGGSGPCAFYFGAPLPLSAGGTAVCVTNQVTGPVTGTVNVEGGDTETSIPLLSKVHLGSTDKPCPLCGRQQCVAGANAGADCGFASECPGGACSHVLKCASGPQNNQPCTITGTSHFGDVSFDCPPDPGALIGVLPIPIDYTSGTATRSLSASNPNCRGPGVGTLKCFCDTCDNETENACTTNAVCTKQCKGGTNNGTNCTDPSECPGGTCTGGICGGKRCRLGTNAGVPCTVNSECPGGGACGVPGLATAPNQCDPGTFCVENPADTDSTNEGICDIGPVEGFCAPHADFGGCTTDGDCAQFNRCVGGTNDGDIGCTTNPQCPGGVCEIQTCSIMKNRECFVDNGVIGKHCFYGTNDPTVDTCTTIADCPDQTPGTFCGGGTVTGSGIPYPPCGNTGSGKVAALFCIPPTSAGSVNAVSGLPGLGRVTIPTTYTFN